MGYFYAICIVVALIAASIGAPMFLCILLGFLAIIGLGERYA